MLGAIDINIEITDRIAIRTVNGNCGLNGRVTELVKWDENHKYCWSLAMWEFNSKEHEFELDLIGDRIFNDIDSDEIEKVWRFSKIVTKMLNEYANIAYYEEDGNYLYD